MSGHALGERSGMMRFLRQVGARCRRLLSGRAASPGPLMLDTRLTVGQVATEGWAAYGAGVSLAACPYIDRRARDAWRSSWRSAQQFDRVFR